MTNIPQNITSRYVGNLLRDGSNSDFIVSTLCRKTSVVDNHVVGHYFEIEILHVAVTGWLAVGATPEQALRNALVKAGVTFR